ncbi:MAG: stage II sporulation protein M [Lewinellaceae bacterium]|jgi:uncharacterized membrane protein SpoIIM required for sporulation|nr:stage II sporulation protein M [Lewinellaceae bacterium]
MRETKFIEQNKEKWAGFEEMLREDHRNPEKLNDLFVQITDDLSYARTFYPNRSVRIYLNTLAQRVFHNIYRGKRFPAGRLKRFWTDELPHLFWEERRALLLSFFLFALAFGIGVVSSIINPEFARVILGDDYVDMTVRNIDSGDPMAVYKESGPFGMTVSIAGRNLFVAFQTAVLGVAASIGTVFILVYNGIMIGAFQYFFVEKGVFWDSFLTIWIHGTLEISAIIIAGAAGLVAGSGLLFPGTYSRAQAFQISMRRGMKIFFGVVPVILLAAVFESYLTRYTDTPDAIRGAFILCSLAFVLWYFVWLPRHKAASGDFAAPVGDKELPPTREHAVDFNAIKNAGEILSDTFTVVSRHPKTAWLGLTGLSLAYVTITYGLSGTGTGIADTFHFDMAEGVMSGVYGLFAGYRFFVQLVLLAVFAVAALLAVSQETGVVAHTAKKALYVALGILLPVAGMAVHFYVEPGQLAWLAAMFAFPFLSLWAAVIYFETANPFLALSRSFTLMRWGPGMLLGFLTVNVGLLLFRFLDTPIWQIATTFFSWMVPPGERNTAGYYQLLNTVAAGVALYFVFLLNMLGGALQYFSCREVADAPSLFESIDRVGATRQIRGLARE